MTSIWIKRHYDFNLNSFWMKFWHDVEDVCANTVFCSPPCFFCFFRSYSCFCSEKTRINSINSMNWTANPLNNSTGSCLGRFSLRFPDFLQDDVCRPGSLQKLPQQYAIHKTVLYPAVNHTRRKLAPLCLSTRPSARNKRGCRKEENRQILDAWRGGTGATLIGGTVSAAGW